MELLAEHLKITGSGRVSNVTRDLKKLLRADRISHLRSVELDSHFVRAVHDSKGKPPVYANLRCGVWYVPPSIRSGCCYFKSTDGHAGSWSFSISRLNLQTALAAAQHGRVMIVDSTRSGKRFPDSLTKTVPIWCCVINRALASCAAEEAAKSGGPVRAHSSNSPAWDELVLPPWLSPSEEAQIEEQIDKWVTALRRPALSPVLERLRRELRAPLLPRWCCPSEGSVGGEPIWYENGVGARLQCEEKGQPYAEVLCVCASSVCSAAR